jgi:hypothetical protein
MCVDLVKINESYHFAKHAKVMGFMKFKGQKLSICKI